VAPAIGGVYVQVFSEKAYCQLVPEMCVPGKTLEISLGASVAQSGNLKEKEAEVETKEDSIQGCTGTQSHLSRCGPR
jgi:hypothetical protein